MQVPSIPTDATPKNARYFVGLLVVVVGYSTALAGCLAFFKIPLSISGAMFLVGLLTAMLLPRWLDRRLALRQSNRAFVAMNLLGSLLIVCVMLLFANSNWKTWYFHPAGFQSAWLVLVSAFFHCKGIRQQSGWKSPKIEILTSEYNEAQASNPYAPPMQARPMTNNPTDP